MIIDTLANAHKYYCVHPLFAQAFQYIAQTNLATIEDGKYTIDGENLKAIISNKVGKTAAESLEKFECHNAHIDIQYCISGTENIAWKPRENCTQPKGEYSAEKDVLFYADAPDMDFTLTNGQFVILFPEDVHAPMINVNDQPIKKAVIKVKI